MSFDNAYEALSDSSDSSAGTEDNDGPNDGPNDGHWAFGTGFTDPLAGVDTTVPADVDAADLALYSLMLGDDALIMSHRLQEWCASAPELEDEVALANIALDLLGQARLLLSRAAAADGRGPGEASSVRGEASSVPGEDRYAFFRAEHEFRNVRLAELERGDFGELTVRLLVFATWRLALLRRLAASRDPVLAAIAAKGVKEVTYHRDYAAQWLVRLGDGTEFSHERAAAGLAAVWPYVAELFRGHDVERRLATVGAGVDPAELRDEFDEVLGQVLAAAMLDAPEVPVQAGAVQAGAGGRDGVHTGAMGSLLAELQSVARADPEATW
jgi:ring-1,2-phenylacetyl-CoA epoxidase subunit PaaC